VQNSNYKKLHLLKKNLFLNHPKNLPHLTTNTHKRQHHKLTESKIIWEEFQPMWSRYLNVMDQRTDRQMDDFAVAISRSA